MPRVPAFVMLVATLVIFLANADALVLQLLAPRYLAPFIGSSIETWTCVIGVFLSGIALGNLVGGRIADKYPSTKTLSILLIIGSVCSLSMLAGMRLCVSSNIHRSMPLTPRIPVLTFAFCFAPSFVLSLITPLTIKLLLSDVRNTGRIAGMIFALSTLGCLLGNYMTGFWLMADYTLDQISVAIAGSLAFTGLLLSLVGYRSPVANDTASASAASEESKTRYRLGKSYAIVFVASFCGISLEFTGSRYLAPIVGVSLYSWTGIIGVMLAGTALGNFCGGIIADRGKILTAVCSAIVRYWFLNAVLLFCVGGLLGFVVGPLGAEQLQKIYKFDLPEPSVLSLIGAAIGGTLLTMMLLPTNAERQTMLQAGVSRNQVLSITLLVGGLATICILAVTAILQQYVPVDDQFTVVPWFGKPFLVDLDYGMVTTLQTLVGRDLVNQILCWTFALFFMPMFLLGMVSPQVIRMSVPDVSHAGRVAGSVYAFSTLGAIVGAFATGYFLIALLGTKSMLLVVALVLTLLATLIGKLWKNSMLLFLGSMVMGAACFGMMFLPSYNKANFDLETRYYAIGINPKDKFEGRQVSSLALDHLKHSYVDINDPSFLGYPHEAIQTELLWMAHDRNPDTKCLVIGGGGYTLPRWVDYMMPGVKIEVVEIDPGVTQIAYDKLMLSSRRIEIGYMLGIPGVVLAENMKLRRPNNIKSIHMDGRQFVSELAPKGHYDLIMQDAVNDLSVPYHLLTKEYNDEIKRILAPKGVYLLTLIDSVRDGVLWRAALKTMRESFKYVYLINSAPFGEVAEQITTGRHVLIVYGSEEPFDAAELQRVLRKAPVGGIAAEAAMGAGWNYPSKAYFLDPGLLEELMTHPVKRAPFGKLPILLRDQYAPVDNLMSGVFRDR